MKTLTVKQIRNAAKKYDYLILRTNNQLFSVNCKAIFLGENKNKPDEMITTIIGFIPCCINEYINSKLPFVS